MISSPSGSLSRRCWNLEVLESCCGPISRTCSRGFFPVWCMEEVFPGTRSSLCIMCDLSRGRKNTHLPRMYYPNIQEDVFSGTYFSTWRRMFFRYIIGGVFPHLLSFCTKKMNFVDTQVMDLNGDIGFTLDTSPTCSRYSCAPGGQFFIASA